MQLQWRQSQTVRCFGNGDIKVTKIAIDPVWYIPGLARRFGVDEHEFRRVIFEQMGGMYPELVTRSDLEVLCPDR